MSEAGTDLNSDIDELLNDDEVDRDDISEDNYIFFEKKPVLRWLNPLVPLIP